MRKKFISAFIMLTIFCTVAIGCADGKDNNETTKTSADAITSEATADAADETAKAFDANTKESKKESPLSSLEDGQYLADFDSDGSMFHANEAKDGKGLLTVKDGKMTIHVAMPSKNVVNLFYGLAEDAKKDGAKWIEPTIDTVTYSDGISEEVNAFDIPVPALDEEFDVALIGKKGKWYDHKVIISNPEPVKEEQ